MKGSSMRKKKDPLYDAYIGEITVIKADMEKSFKEKEKAGLLSNAAISEVFSPTDNMSMRDQHIYLNYLEKAGIYECKSDKAVRALIDKAISVLPSEEETKAAESIQRLTKSLTECILVKKIMTEADTDVLLLPMHRLNWSEKKEYADSLIAVLESTDSWQEIVEKVKVIQKEKFGTEE